MIRSAILAGVLCTSSARGSSWDEIMGMWLLSMEEGGSSSGGDGNICAKVNMEVQQDLTLERQAFDAEVKIHNGYTTVALQDVEVKIWINDLEGNWIPTTSDPSDTNAWFFIREPDLTKIDKVDGRGTVNEATTAEIHWLIVPAPGTGGNSAFGRDYLVGGRLRYKSGNGETLITLNPDQIRVKPMPKLAMDYFLPAKVFGDDPLTLPIEPPEPFDYGLRIRNAGASAAKSVNMNAGYPEIQRNNQDLLVNFQVLGVEVNGQALDPAKQSAFNFGTIEPNRAGMALVTMECSLSGEFVGLKATVKHADELGGELTSLITEKNVHKLLHAVIMDVPGRDKLRDFLADDDGSIRLYESENIDMAVTNFSSVASLQHVDTGEGQEIITYRFRVPGSLGPLYAGVPFPDGQQYMLDSVRRAIDGSSLPANNAWMTLDRETGTTNRTCNLHVFDSFGGGEYEVRLRVRPIEHNFPPVLQFIGRKVVFEGQQLGFQIKASDANKVFPAMSAGPLPSGSTFADYRDGTGFFHWRPQVGQYGVYPLRFNATDGEFNDWEIVKIYVGHPGEELCGGIPCSLKDWSVEIANLESASSSTRSTVQWDSISGLYYDLYVSDSPYSDSMSWNISSGAQPGSGARESIQDAGLGTNRNYRFYKMVLAGDSPDTNKVWGVIRKNLAPGYTMISPPVRTDRRFDGEMGFDLAEELQGRDGGIGSGADEVYILQTNGTWRTLYLDAGGAWREADGTESTYELPAGLGLWVARKTATPARTTFTGPVGNDGTQVVTLQPGFNLIGLSEGKNLPLAQTLATANPQGGAIEEIADQLVIQKPNGSWRRLMYVQGWGAPYDGNWFDLSTYQIVTTNEVLEPGAAYYYLRRGVPTHH
jgi:hypothetical protein